MRPKKLWLEQGAATLDEADTKNERKTEVEEA